MCAAPETPSPGSTSWPSRQNPPGARPAAAASLRATPSLGRLSTTVRRAGSQAKHGDGAKHDQLHKVPTPTSSEPCPNSPVHGGKPPQQSVPPTLPKSQAVNWRRTTNIHQCDGPESLQENLSAHRGRPHLHTQALVHTRETTAKQSPHPNAGKAQQTLQPRTQGTCQRTPQQLRTTRTKRRPNRTYAGRTPKAPRPRPPGNEYH